MFLRLPWLTAALTPITFGIIGLIASGIGALGSWLGGRATSKQHERQLASEERRQAMAQAAMREWYANQAEQQAAAEAQRAQAISRLGGHLGIDPALMQAGLALRPRGQVMPPNFGGMAGQTRGMPAPQQFDTAALISGAVGPQSQGMQDTDWWQGGTKGLPWYLGGQRQQPAQQQTRVAQAASDDPLLI